LKSLQAATLLCPFEDTFIMSKPTGHKQFANSANVFLQIICSNLLLISLLQQTH